MRRIHKAALSGLAGCALVFGATQAANGESPVLYYNSTGVVLVDLQPDQEAPKPLDGAKATLRIKQAPEATNFKLTVTGIDEATAGHDYGAHLHVGDCLPNGADPNNPGPHYRNVFGAGATPENEVWFDLVPNDSGTATDSTTVPFVPIDNDGSAGLMSIVIHAASAATPAAQSPKLACLPLTVTESPKWSDILGLG